MRRLTLAIWLIALCTFARADEWSKTFNLTGKPDLRVETSDANITVDVWEQSVIQAHVTTESYKIGEHGIQIEDQQSGDSVALTVRFPHHYVAFEVRHHHHAVNIDIHMPREGQVNLHTGDGDIHLSGVKGSMVVESGDGHQEIESVDGTLKAHAGDGHIRTTGRFDGLDVSTGDGRIETKVLPGSTVAGGWNFHAGDGSITLQIPDNLAADVELHTGDGHINVDLPISVSGRMATNRVHGKLNGGGNLLTVRTGDGSITLEKS
jgi:Putative adhesin